MDDPSAIAQSIVPRTTRPTLAALPIATGDGSRWIGKALAGDILNETVRRGRLRALSRHTTFMDGTTMQAVHDFGADAVLSGCLKDTHLTLSLQWVGCDQHKLSLPNVQAETLQATADIAVDWLLDGLGGTLDLPAMEAPSRRSSLAHQPHAACLQALEAFWTFSAQGNAEALEIIRPLCEAYPSFGFAHALRACLVTRGYRSGWIGGRDDVVAEVGPALKTAYANWSDDPRLLWAAAFAEAMLFRRYQLAATLARRAAFEQPHDSAALTWGALFLSYDLDFDGALNLARQAIRVSPRDAMRVTQGFAGALAAIHGGRDREALELCDMVLCMNPKMINILRIRAAALVHLGEVNTARETMAQVLQIDPNETRTLVAQVNPLREWSGFSRFLDGLAGAGMP